MYPVESPCATIDPLSEGSLSSTSANSGPSTRDYYKIKLIWYPWFAASFEQPGVKGECTTLAASNAIAFSPWRTKSHLRRPPYKMWTLRHRLCRNQYSISRPALPKFKNLSASTKYESTTKVVLSSAHHETCLLHRRSPPPAQPWHRVTSTSPLASFPLWWLRLHTSTNRVRNPKCLDGLGMAACRRDGRQATSLRCL